LPGDSENASLNRTPRNRPALDALIALVLVAAPVRELDEFVLRGLLLDES
jgi:hypothetical protein